MEFIITTLTSSIGIGTLVFFLLKNFLGEKFKNMATLQDIGDITHEVESVKKTFQDGNEKLKQELSVLTNKHNVLFTEEKEALHVYFSAWYVWINMIEIMVVDYVTKSYKEVEDIEKCRYDISKSKSSSYEKVLISLSKLQLFLNDDNIINSAYELNLKTSEHQKIHEDYIDDYANFSYSIYLLEGKLEEAKAENNKFNEKVAYEVLMDKRKAKTECGIIFTDTKQTKFREVETAKKKFINLCRDYIRKDF